MAIVALFGKLIISKRNAARKPFKCTQPDPVLFSVCIHILEYQKKAQGTEKNNNKDESPWRLGS